MKVDSHPIYNEKSIVIGCNYHTTWQSKKSMRFVLKEIKEHKARLVTRNTNKNFWTNIEDLVFIMTSHNIRKANQITNPLKT